MSAGIEATLLHQFSLARIKEVYANYLTINHDRMLKCIADELFMRRDNLHSYHIVSNLVVQALAQYESERHDCSFDIDTANSHLITIRQKGKSYRFSAYDIIRNLMPIHEPTWFEPASKQVK